MLTFKRFLVEASTTIKLKSFGPANMHDASGKLKLGMLGDFYRRANRIFNAPDPVSGVHVVFSAKDHSVLSPGDVVNLTGNMSPPKDQLDLSKHSHNIIPTVEVVHPTKGTHSVSLQTLKYAEPKRAPGSRVASYNEEHALKRTIQQYHRKLVNSKPTELIADVDQSVTNKTHPFHIDNLPKEEFFKSVKGDPVGTHSLFRNSVITAIHMAKEFPSLVNKNTKLTVTGNSRGQLSDFYKQYGVKQNSASATPKTDLLASATNGVRKYSIKMGKGSQLMSSNVKAIGEGGRIGGEPVAVYDAAALKMVNTHPRFDNDKEGHVARINKAIQDISRPLVTFKNRTRSEQKDAVQEADQHLERLHTEYPELAQHVAHEAGVGNYKFDDDISRPTHIVTLAHIGSPKEKRSVLPGLFAVQKVEDHDWSSYGRPRISLGKHTGSASWRIGS